jgi:hypothetical protein
MQKISTMDNSVIKDRLISFEFYLYPPPANKKCTAYVRGGKLINVHVREEVDRQYAEHVAQNILNNITSV